MKRLIFHQRREKYLSSLAVHVMIIKTVLNPLSVVVIASASLAVSVTKAINRPLTIVITVSNVCLGVVIKTPVVMLLTV